LKTKLTIDVGVNRAKRTKTDIVVNMANNKTLGLICFGLCVRVPLTRRIKARRQTICSKIIVAAPQIRAKKGKKKFCKIFHVSVNILRLTMLKKFHSFWTLKIHFLFNSFGMQ
jgi:hypothetical protein